MPCRNLQSSATRMIRGLAETRLACRGSSYAAARSVIAIPIRYGKSDRRAKSLVRGTRARAGTRNLRERLAALLHALRHVVDALFDELVGKIHAAALRGHHAGLAGEALKGVLVESRFAFRHARCPGDRIPEFRRATDAEAVAGGARGVVKLFTRCRRGGRSRRCRRTRLRNLH